MSLPGPKYQFVAVQRYDRCRWNTGRSVDVADTAARDPKATFTLVRQTVAGASRFPRLVAGFDLNAVRLSGKLLRMRLLTSPLIPLGLGLQALNMILQYISHPAISEWRVLAFFWTTLFVGDTLLRYWYRRRREKSSKDVAGIFE
jgi:hypothetical protein